MKNQFLNDVLEGLSCQKKEINCKYFYNTVGSNLFKKICLQNEYYLTNTETDILKKFRKEISQGIGKDITLIDYGCGSSDKINLLLDCLPKVSALISIDISKSELIKVRNKINFIHPNLKVFPIVADFTQKIDLEKFILAGTIPVVFFSGSTIGNFSPKNTITFLRDMVATIGTFGKVLIGVDLKKDINILNSAYNDANGVTALFNKNLLVRINAELNGNFEINQFRHLAFYNRKLSRVEMHLESKIDQTVTVGATIFKFKKGETIHTENSYKYVLSDFKKLAEKSGLEFLDAWLDEKSFFSVQLFKVQKN